MGGDYSRGDILIMTNTSEAMSYAALMQWLRSHRAQIDNEMQAGDTLAGAVFAADVVHKNLNTVKTEAALRKAVIDYMEMKDDE